MFIHFPLRFVFWCSWYFSSPPPLNSLFNFRIESRRKCAATIMCPVKPANQRFFFEEMSSWCSARRYRLWLCHECSVSRLAKEMTHDLEMNFNKIAPSIWQRSWLRSCYAASARASWCSCTWLVIAAPRWVQHGQTGDVQGYSRFLRLYEPASSPSVQNRSASSFSFALNSFRVLLADSATGCVRAESSSAVACRAFFLIRIS